MFQNLTRSFVSKSYKKLTVFGVGVEGEPVAVRGRFAVLETVELVVRVAVVNVEAVPEVTFGSKLYILDRNISVLMDWRK